MVKLCNICDSKRYVVATRDDGRRAIERCDTCSWEVLSDEDAAKLAKADGWHCAGDYPCYVDES